MKIWRVCVLGLGIGIFCPARTEKWAFDQRQILLAQNEGSDFPDDLTTAQILDAFKRRGRFRFITNKEGAGPVTPLKVPLGFAWTSSPSVRHLGLKYKADGILLLRKKGVKIELEWYSVADGEPIFFESQSLPEASPDQQPIRKERLQRWVTEIWAKIPGDGYVIRRDLDSVYIEGAQELALKVGDRIDLRRIIRVQKHPVLKTLMKAETSQTGVAVVMEVAEPLTRAKIEYESPADPIEAGDRYQYRKVLEGNVATLPSNASPAAFTAPPPSAADSATPAEPRMAEVTALAGVGSFRHAEKFGSSTYNMRGTAPGFDLQARGFLTREWLAEAQVGMDYFKFSDVAGEYQARSLSASTLQWRVNGGYRIFFMEDVFPSGELTAALGYSKYSLKIKKSDSDVAPQSKSYAGFEVGLKVQVPIVERFAANLALYKMLDPGLSESPKSAGSTSSHSVWQFQLGGKYLLNPIQEVLAGIRYTSLSSDYEGQGTRVTASQNTKVTSTSFFGGYTHKF